MDVGSAEPVRILHVDDEPDLTEMVATFLEAEDDRFAVETATSATEAMDLLGPGTDCIVSDYDMPGRNGIEFLGDVRERHPELPFVLYTGKGSEEVASDAISAGVTDYLQKGTGTDQYTVLANRIANAVDQYRSREALEASQKRLSLFIEQSPLGVIEWDDDFEAVRVNDAAIEILGYSESDLCGRSWKTIVPESDRDQVDEVVDDLLSAEGGYHSVNKNVRKDGDSIVCEWHNRVVTDEDGETVAIFSQFQDVTDRMDRERKLTALHDFATSLEGTESAESICERGIEASQGILEFDLSVVDLVQDGYLSKAAVSEEIPPESAQRMSVDEGIAGRTYRTGESMLVHDVADHAEARPQGPFRSAVSVPIGEHGVFQAVAEETGAFDESDLELAELLVSHIASALDRFEHERRLERQNERLDQFAGVVSHDLRNPLNVAHAQVELAMEENDSERLRTANRAHERMETLIDDLLTVARGDESATSVESVALADVVDQCWRNVDTGEATVETETDLVLRADRSRLKQLLENLVRNAVEHGGPDVTVTVGDLPDEEGFYLEDDGAGIPEDDREDVFDVGYSTADEGTGFGLSIVEQVVQAHGWSVRVTDGEDGGARIEVAGVTPGEH